MEHKFGLMRENIQCLSLRDICTHARICYHPLDRSRFRVLADVQLTLNSFSRQHSLPCSIAIISVNLRTTVPLSCRILMFSTSTREKTEIGRSGRISPSDTSKAFAAWLLLSSTA